MAKKTLPTTTVTTIPQQDAVLFSVTEETIKRFEGYRSLTVADIHDKKALAQVHDARMELVKARTTVDKVRKEMNEDARRQIAENDTKAKALLAKFEPIEKFLKSEEDRVEAALESERVAAKVALLTKRKAALSEVVGEFTDMLAAYPDDYLSAVADATFTPLLVTLRVQVEGRKQLAAQEAERKVAAEREAAALAEQQRLAEVERQKQQAIEDAARKAAQEKLDAERAEFEKMMREAAERQAAQDAAREQAEAERLAAELAKIAEERAELESQRMAIEDERQRQEAAALAIRQAEMDRIDAENKAFAEAERLKAVEAARIARERMAEIERQRIEAMRPDIEKLFEWVSTVEESALDTRPTVGNACEDILMDMVRDLAGAIESMRGRLS